LEFTYWFGVGVPTTPKNSREANAAYTFLALNSLGAAALNVFHPQLPILPRRTRAERAFMHYSALTRIHASET